MTTRYYYDSNLNRSFPDISYHESLSPPAYRTDFLLSPQKTRMLEFSNPYSLSPLRKEVVKKSAHIPIENKEIEPRVSYHYLGEYERPVTPEKKEYKTVTNISPYDYRTYNPLGNHEYYNYTYDDRPKKEYEPIEQPKRAHFSDESYDPKLKVVERKLDIIRSDIAELKYRVSASPERRSYQKPGIFEESRNSDLFINESPLYINKTDRIKRSGHRSTENVPKYIKTYTQTEKSPLRASTMNDKKSKIFSPLSFKSPPPDASTVLKQLETPKVYNVSHYESPKRASPKYYPYGKIDLSREVVIPSKNPLFGDEEKPKRGGMQRKTTDGGEGTIFCIDCEQYIRAGNANLHSMFCYKEINGDRGQESNLKNGELRTKIRNISYFLVDELARLRKKGVESDNERFWGNCEELNETIKAILVCKREIEIHSLLDRLRKANERLEKMGGSWALEVRKLGMKAEEELTS